MYPSLLCISSPFLPPSVHSPCYLFTKQEPFFWGRFCLLHAPIFPLNSETGFQLEVFQICDLTLKSDTATIATLRPALPLFGQDNSPPPFFFFFARLLIALRRN